MGDCPESMMQSVHLLTQWTTESAFAIVVLTERFVCSLAHSVGICNCTGVEHISCEREMANTRAPRTTPACHIDVLPG